MNLKDIASIAGKPGLFLILKPTHAGVIVEAVGDKKTRTVITANHRISILKEISIFTTSAEGSEPLSNVFLTIEDLYGDKLDVTPTSSASDLTQFISKVVPDYDTAKVYASDIKKLIGWYMLLKTNLPQIFEDIREERQIAQNAAVAAEKEE